MTSVTIAARVISEQYRASMETLVKAARSSASEIARHFRRPWPDPPIPLHGFTPNYDLVCGVCSVGPEECRGGRA